MSLPAATPAESRQAVARSAKVDAGFASERATTVVNKRALRTAG